MLYDSIIFDVDGTLWDSTPVVAKAYNKVFEVEGEEVRVDADRLKQLFGKPMDVIFQEIFPEKSPEECHRLGSACEEYENEMLLEESGYVYPEVKETIKKLSEKYRMFIVSNCQIGYIDLVMKACGITDMIEGHLCFGQTQTSKGQTMLRIMKEYDLKAPVYVGDIQGDADACAEAGIPIIWAKYGFGTVKQPEHTIEAFKDLADLLL